MCMWVSRDRYLREITSALREKERALALEKFVEDRDQEIGRLRGELAESRRDGDIERTKVSVLMTELTEVLKRPPIVLPAPAPVDVVPIITEIRKAFIVDQPPVNATNQGPLLYTSEVPMAKEGEWFPDVEFDDYLRKMGDQWPTKGGWVAGSPMPTSLDAPMNGMRSDGTPRTMFKSGESGPPPVGGIE